MDEAAEPVTSLLTAHRDAPGRTARALVGKETPAERETLRLTPEIERIAGSRMPAREEDREAAGQDPARRPGAALAAADPSGPRGGAPFRLGGRTGPPQAAALGQQA